MPRGGVSSEQRKGKILQGSFQSQFLMAASIPQKSDIYLAVQQSFDKVCRVVLLQL